MSDSCVSQLLAIFLQIYSPFYDNSTLKTHGVFLDIPKAFDKVSHAAFIYKLKSVGVSGDLVKLINHFLNNRFQRVLQNDQTSDWLPVKGGLPQGSILGPLFFLIYINDISDNLVSQVKLFSDDTLLPSIVHDNDASRTALNNDLKK